MYDFEANESNLATLFLQNLSFEYEAISANALLLLGFCNAAAFTDDAHKLVKL